MRTRRIASLLAAVAGLGLLGVVSTGCRPAGSSLMGKEPAGSPVAIGGAITNGASGSMVIQGVMSEKCPVAGCWFFLKDATGTIKVDTKSAGFVVVDVPLGVRMTVTGRLVHEGGETVLAADGLRY